MNEKQREILEDNFNIYEDTNDDYIQLEAWTNGGVDMFIDIKKDEDVIKELENYIDIFDIDEEIEIYRQAEDYKQAFTIRESLEDFENWIEYIQDIINQLEEVK